MNLKFADQADPVYLTHVLIFTYVPPIGVGDIFLEQDDFCPRNNLYTNRKNCSVFFLKDVEETHIFWRRGGGSLQPRVCAHALYTFYKGKYLTSASSTWLRASFRYKTANSR